MIVYEKKEQIGIITLNRQEKRNALNYELIAKLKDLFQSIESDIEVKVIILRARGKTFCSGIDLASLRQLQQASYEENLADSNHLKELFTLIYTLSKPVIAEVEGHALAGGCGLVTVCDVVIASPHVKLGYPEVKIGFVPAIVMFFLIRKIGEQKARPLLLGGDLISAKEALEIGLVHRLVESDQLSSFVFSYAQQWVCNNSSHAMAQTKSMMASIQSMTLDEAMKYATEINAVARQTDDCKKGIVAFLNKEKPIW